MPIHTFYIHSDQRSDSKTNPNNFTVNLPIIKNVQEVAISDVNFLNTQFNINSSNNVLTIQEGGNVDLTIPIGQYTADELATEIKTQWEASVLTGTLVITVDSQSKTYTMTSTVNFNIVIQGLASYLGFTQSQTDALTQTSNTIYDLSGASEFYIESNAFNTETYLDSNKRNILKKVHLSNFGVSTIEVFRDKLNFIPNRSKKSVQQVNFRVIDKNGKLLDNVRDWSFTLHIVGDIDK
jgi:hypothetical protein